MIKSTKVSPGNYDVEAFGRKFEIERDAYGIWQLFEIVDNGREYCQDFATKRAALAAIQEFA